MTRLRYFLRLAACLALCGPCGRLAAWQTGSGTQRLITEKDLFDFQWIGDPKLSPDGSRAVFVKVRVDAKRTGYETSLWIQDLKTPEAAPEQLTNGPHDSSPRWSPDGQMLAFTRAERKDGKPTPAQLYLLSFSGGEPRVLTSLPGGAGAPSFSPDGKHLLFTSDTSPEDLAKAERTKAGDKPPEHVSDVRVITHAMYRMNGEGYIDYKHPSHLWILDVPGAGAQAPKPRQLTSGRFTERDPVWAADSASVYYLTNTKDEPYYSPPQSELERIGVNGGAPERVALFPFEAGQLSISPDGKRMALHASASVPIRSYSQTDLWVMELTPGAQPKNLTERYDYDLGGGVGGDNRAPRAAGSNAPLWMADGNSILDVSGKEGTANVVSIDAASGTVKEFTRGAQAVQLLTQSADRRTCSH